ncbi:MAG: peptidylprolyl isomerase [Spirochaetaceae bacterium]
MKKLLLGITLITLLFSCNTAPEDKAIASIGKEKITQGEFDAELKKFQGIIPADYEMSEEENAQFESQILNSMIQKRVFTKKLDELGIEADPQSVEDQLQQMITQYGSEEKMIQEIEAQGFTIDELKKEFTYQFRLQDLSEYASETDEITLSDEDLNTYYEENKERIFTKQPTINSCRHILIVPEEGDTAKALVEATAIREEIMSGLDFGEAAAKYSQGPSNTNGGQLGQFQKGQMVKEFEDVAFNIAINEVSQPVLTQFGYHIIKVESRSDAEIAPFEETVTFITSQLKRERFFTKVEEDAKIKKPDWAEIKE